MVEVFYKTRLFKTLIYPFLNFELFLSVKIQVQGCIFVSGGPSTIITEKYSLIFRRHSPG